MTSGWITGMHPDPRTPLPEKHYFCPLSFAMPEFFKIMSVFLVAMVKYFYTPLYAYLTGLEFWVSVVTMIIGGITSFSFFYFISHFIVISTKYIKPAVRNILPDNWIEKLDDRKEQKALKRKNAKKFTRKNKMIIRMRNLGMWGIILTTPVLLSLPVGAFLLLKYYSDRKGVLFFALLTIALEGFLLCFLVWNFPSLRPD